MSGGFRVSTDVLRTHAGRVGMVRDDVGLATSAAGQVNLHDGSFGLLCAFLPPIFGLVEGAVEEAVHAAQEVLDATGDTLRSVARMYDDADAEVSAGFRGIMGGERA